MNRLLLPLFFLFAFSCCAADRQNIKLAVYLPQSPPYMFIDENTGQLTGIIPDIVKQFASKHSLQFDVDYLNRVRAETYLYSGQADVSLLAPSWVEKPEQLVFSEPLYVNGDRFYSIQPIAGELVFNKQVVCTREFFKYPIFDQLVAEGKVVRMNVKSEASQLRMLLSNRCDLAYLNEWVGDHMIKTEFSFAQFYKAPNTFDSTNGVLAFNKSWQNQIKDFNEFVHRIKQSGELAQIVAKYLN